MSDHSCQPCNAACLLCNLSSTNCQKCQNVSGVLYYYYAEKCLITCPNGYYGQNTNNTCVLCNLACSLCFGPSTDQCYSCQPDNQTLLYYYLSYGTTSCVQICPYGQYAVNGSYTCQPCNINCATCVGTSTNCLTCTYVNTINIVYLYQNACIITCPNNYWMNSTVQLDHKCTLCHPFCLVCTGPSNLACSVCGNQTVDNATVSYYKDLDSTTCNPTCPNGQYIDSIINNICVPCNSRCLKCAASSTNCSQCAFSYYLYAPDFNCTSQCPANFYNDPVITTNYYYCTQCTPGCLTCTGPGLLSCQSCQNVTTNSSVISYYKDQIGPYCTTTCSSGYYGNALNNNCDPCQIGCVTCLTNASNCFSCKSSGGSDYYLIYNGTGCVTVCPGGYYGNSTDYTCRPCIYYTLAGKCLFTCPTNTYASLVSAGKYVCQDCSTVNTTGPCQSANTFSVQTTVIDNGNSLQNKIFLSGGLLSSITAEQLMKNLTVYVTTPSRRLLFEVNRLLVVNTPLTVKSITISSDRTVLYIITNY